MLDLDYKNISSLFEQSATPALTPLDTLKAKMAEANITELALLQFVTSKGYQEDAATVADYPDSFINGWVLKYWSQIVTALTADAINNKNNGGIGNE